MGGSFGFNQRTRRKRLHWRGSLDCLNVYKSCLAFLCQLPIIHTIGYCATFRSRSHMAKSPKLNFNFIYYDVWNYNAINSNCLAFGIFLNRVIKT